MDSSVSPSSDGPSSDAPTAGLHHVTAICSDAQRTVDFYVRVLGLRFLKRTVNFDDPSTYHLYFGDYVGHPGTALTFFAWKNLPPGKPGAGQAVRVAFKVPEGSLEDWHERLAAGEWRGRFSDWDAELSEPEERFGRRMLRFRDPDGLGLALVEREEVAEDLQWAEGPVPAGSEGMAIAGFHGVTLAETELEPAAGVLVDVLGFRKVAEEDEHVLYAARAPEGWGEPGRPGRDPAGDGGPPRDTAVRLGPRDTVVEVEAAPESAAGRVAQGSIHHVAYRAASDDHQDSLREGARGAGLGPTPVIDRYYFRSVYFREPGGVLFEVATDDPGFTRDQDPSELGEGLTLPPWLEPRREMIEAHLDPVEPPSEEAVKAGAGEAVAGTEKGTDEGAGRADGGTDTGEVEEVRS
ncbi:MAG: VOC family protein [Longimicrobiales bacterium]